MGETPEPSQERAKQEVYIQSSNGASFSRHEDDAEDYMWLRGQDVLIVGENDEVIEIRLQGMAGYGNDNPEREVQVLFTVAYDLMYDARLHTLEVPLTAEQQTSRPESSQTIDILAHILGLHSRREEIRENPTIETMMAAYSV
ncbi:hypothetical protein ACFL1B_00275 [Nanoarchaeota archaeon]